jgi:hypothetical protein
MLDISKIQPNVVSRGVTGKYFLFYGEPSTRKTSVAAMFPKCLLLATEIGYSMIPGVHAANIQNWADFRDTVRQLKQPDVKEAYQTIAIDTVGLLTDMCMKYICDINGVSNLSDVPWGGGWTQFKKEFRTQLNTIAQLGYGIVLIAHSDSKRNEEGGIVSALPSMDKKPRESVIALVDFIFYLQKEVSDSNPNITTVYAYSKLPSSIESKTRAKYLKARFEFNFENVEREINLALDALEQETAGSVTMAAVNQHVIEHIPLEDLKGKIIAMAQVLLDNPNQEVGNAVRTQLVTIMKGVKVSEAPQADYDKLTALYEALIEIREGI